MFHSLWHTGNLWRDDGKYPEVCKQMIEALYPSDLRDLYSGKDIDRDSVINWFKLTGQLGQAAARQSTTMYILLNEGIPKPSDGFITKPKPTSKKPTKQKSITTEVQEDNVDTNDSVNNNSTGEDSSQKKPEIVTQTKSQTNLQTGNIWGKGMSLHIDLQIHISHQATPEQIDSIFASMAKHLPTIANQENIDE